MTMRSKTRYLILVGMSLAVAWIALAAPSDAEPFDFEKASRNVPKPRELYPLVKQDMVATDLKLIADEIIPSVSDPSKKLRKITVFFRSFKIEGKVWGHSCVILTPADTTINNTPERRGKVAVVGSPGWVAFPAHVAKYAEPIVSRMGYPAIVVENQSHPPVKPD